jgi:hypothetical protein
VKAAFAVGWAEKFPFDVIALLTSQHEAQRYADGAAYVFSVFALPVYEDYSEVPRALRPPRPAAAPHFWRERISDELTLTADALMEGEIDPVAPGPVVAVGDFESTGPQEVRLLFTHTSDAERYLQDTLDWLAGMQWSDVRPVYGSYDDCPPDARYNVPGPPLSQHIRPR